VKAAVVAAIAPAQAPIVMVEPIASLQQPTQSAFSFLLPKSPAIFDNLRIVGTLGSGMYGIVFHVKGSDGRDYALKRQKISEADARNVRNPHFPVWEMIEFMEWISDPRIPPEFSRHFVHLYAWRIRTDLKNLKGFRRNLTGWPASRAQFFAKDDESPYTLELLMDLKGGVSRMTWQRASLDGPKRLSAIAQTLFAIKVLEDNHWRHRDVHGGNIFFEEVDPSGPLRVISLPLLNGKPAIRLPTLGTLWCLGDYDIVTKVPPEFANPFHNPDFHSFMLMCVVNTDPLFSNDAREGKEWPNFDILMYDMIRKHPATWKRAKDYFLSHPVSASDKFSQRAKQAVEDIESYFGQSDPRTTRRVGGLWNFADLDTFSFSASASSPFSTPGLNHPPPPLPQQQQQHHWDPNARADAKQSFAQAVSNDGGVRRQTGPLSYLPSTKLINAVTGEVMSDGGWSMLSPISVGGDIGLDLEKLFQMLFGMNDFDAVLHELILWYAIVSPEDYADVHGFTQVPVAVIPKELIVRIKMQPTLAESIAVVAHELALALRNFQPNMPVPVRAAPRQRSALSAFLMTLTRPPTTPAFTSDVVMGDEKDEKQEPPDRLNNIQQIQHLLQSEDAKQAPKVFQIMAAAAAAAAASDEKVQPRPKRQKVVHKTEKESLEDLTFPDPGRHHGGGGGADSGPFPVRNRFAPNLPPAHDVMILTKNQEGENDHDNVMINMLEDLFLQVAAVGRPLLRELATRPDAVAQTFKQHASDIDSLESLLNDIQELRHDMDSRAKIKETRHRAFPSLLDEVLKRKS
jgi:serine/threonine protein kinase